MQGRFFALADRLMQGLDGGERLSLALEGERSDFVRLSQARVRQAGSVERSTVTLDLVAGGRRAAARCDLQGSVGADRPRLEGLLEGLRSRLSQLAPDPYLILPAEVCSTEQVDDRSPPPAREAVAQVMDEAAHMDLVGIWASGAMFAGLADSAGQRGWHASQSFNLDWSCHLAGDKAVKARYAGVDWDPAELARRMAGVRERLAVVARPALTLEPGRYRAYLAPAALRELLGLVAWGGFGLKDHRTGSSPLMRMVAEGRRLHPGVSLVEDHARGLTPRFTAEGFVKPPRVDLIQGGVYRDCLAAPRSAAEYGVGVNAGTEAPESLDMAAGDLPAEEVLAALGTGLYVSDLWYGNFSDRADCRITAMTRYACLWVENGEIQGPVDVMRIDDSVYHLLGDRLEALTRERELILDPGTYGGRSWVSHRLPGALVDGITLTL
ncbi:MAG: metallopeptidase TldD-related protein [Chromatiales bacterium]|jgi:predicted Zn-dependent protease